MKNLMKKLSVVLSLIMVFGLVGCSNSGTSDKEANTSDNKAKKIAVLLPGSTGYFVATKKGIDKTAKEKGIEVEYADAGWDASKQLSQAEDFIAKGVDMIALCGVESSASEKIVKTANESKVPVIAFTNSIGDDPTGKYEGLVTYIGQNEVETGGLTAEIAKNLLGEKGGKAVLIEGVPGTAPQVMRRKGVEEALKGSNIEIVYKQTSNWEKEQALKITEDLIQKKMDFDVIICQDDNSATGAGQALKDASLKDKVKVIGLGGSKDGLQAIKDGLIDGTTYMSAVKEGSLVIEMAAKHFNGEKVDAVNQIKQVEVNKDNVKDFEGEW